MDSFRESARGAEPAPEPPSLPVAAMYSQSQQTASTPRLQRRGSSFDVSPAPMTFNAPEKAYNAVTQHLFSATGPSQPTIPARSGSLPGLSQYPPSVHGGVTAENQHPSHQHVTPVQGASQNYVTRPDWSNHSLTQPQQRVPMSRVLHNQVSRTPQLAGTSNYALSSSGYISPHATRSFRQTEARPRPAYENNNHYQEINFNVSTGNMPKFPRNSTQSSSLQDLSPASARLNHLTANAGSQGIPHPQKSPLRRGPVSYISQSADTKQKASPENTKKWTFVFEVPSSDTRTRNPLNGEGTRHRLERSSGDDEETMPKQKRMRTAARTLETAPLTFAAMDGASNAIHPPSVSFQGMVDNNSVTRAPSVLPVLPVQSVPSSSATEIAGSATMDVTLNRALFEQTLNHHAKSNQSAQGGPYLQDHASGAAFSISLSPQEDLNQVTVNPSPAQESEATTNTGPSQEFPTPFVQRSNDSPIANTRTDEASAQEPGVTTNIVHRQVTASPPVRRSIYGTVPGTGTDESSADEFEEGANQILKPWGVNMKLNKKRAGLTYQYMPYFRKATAEELNSEPDVDWRNLWTLASSYGRRGLVGMKM